METIDRNCIALYPLCVLVSSRAALRVALVPCLGLGDALISAVLAYNLKRAGHQVTIFHPIFPKLSQLFPGIDVEPRPSSPTFFQTHQRSILFYEKLDWMQSLLKKGLADHRSSLTVLNPIATPNQDYPFWEEGRFNGAIPFVDNLLHYLKEFWGISAPKRHNGVLLPDSVKRRRFENRVIIHPTSSRRGKNWTKSKYLALAHSLRKRGFKPAFILTPEEASDWKEVETPVFSSLVELTCFIAESGCMVGNDSGIGHLASCVGVPTLTICRSPMAAAFWRPAFGPGEVIVPPRWIPNIKGMRWRDQKWQHFITVKQVEQRLAALRAKNAS